MDGQMDQRAARVQQRLVLLREMGKIGAAGLESLRGELEAAEAAGDSEAGATVRADIETVRQWLAWVAHETRKAALCSRSNGASHGSISRRRTGAAICLGAPLHRSPC